MAHINYVQSIDSVTLQNQFKDVIGTYGPRKFWMENNKLFYKREQSENGQVFPKIDVLPISKERYVNITKLNFGFAFEYENNKIKSSFSYQYILEEETWIKMEVNGNTFKKD